MYNQVPVNTLIEEMEKVRNGFHTNGFFNLSEEGELETRRFFRSSSELAKITDEILDKYNDHPSIHCTGEICKHFRNFTRGYRSEHGRGTEEINNIFEIEEENCFLPKGNGCFLKCINHILKKNLPKHLWNSCNHIKKTKCYDLM